MLSPKEIQEATFVKAVFGGYDMKSVDDFLDQMSADYVTLYNENASLKQKLRVLVQKLEEYRTKEESVNRASMQAAALAADAERKAQQAAQQAAAPAPAPAQPNAADQEAVKKAHEEAKAAIAAEEQRVEKARRVAENFIGAVEGTVQKHLQLLDELKKLDPGTSEKARRPYDFDSEPDAAPAPVSAPAQDAADVATEISQNIERFYGADEKADPDATKVRTIDSGAKNAAKKNRFSDLQFGPGYDPRG